jgi:hypothetical protein
MFTFNATTAAWRFNFPYYQLSMLEQAQSIQAAS